MSIQQSQHPPTREVEGRACVFSIDKAAGIAALVTGVFVAIMAMVVASGIFGSGYMYFLAAGLAIGSILPLAFAVSKLFSDN